MYIIKNTERNNNTASEYETKSLLYLVGIHKDRDDVSILFVDCFNDVTGGNIRLDKLWDVQSKGVSSLRPKTIGKALITLFENFISEIEFSYYILVSPQISSQYILDSTLKEFDINNFYEKQKIKDGLHDEYVRRHKDNIDLRLNNTIDNFLDNVCFVIADSPKDFYIKNILKFKNHDIQSEDFYNSIFDEIRNRQSSLKNIYIEGMRINSPADMKNLKKFITTNDIKVMMINRIIGIELFKQGMIPLEYYDELRLLDQEEKAYLIQENNAKITRTIFNRNNKITFWRLLEIMVNAAREMKNRTPREIFETLPKNSYEKVTTLDANSIIFFLSLIQQGLHNDN